MIKYDRLKSFIELNETIEVDKYVIMTHTKEDFEILRDILIELDYSPAIPLDTLETMMNNFVTNNGYECSWRISKRMGIAWNNQSIDWWCENSQSDIINLCSDGTVQVINAKSTTVIPVIRNGKQCGYYYYTSNNMEV